MSDEIIALIAGMMVAIIIGGIFIYVITVIASWKLFTKAGIAGWKALIPIYNSYLLFKIAGCPSWFWIMIVASFAEGLCSSLSSSASDTAATIYSIVNIVASIMVIVASIKECAGLAKSFNRGTGTAIGLFFFPQIFQLILAFGSAEYVGNKAE